VKPAQLDPLRVVHVVTVDHFDGRPILPGFFDDGIFWACVERLPGGRTRWRRIYLAEPEKTLTRCARRRPGRTADYSPRHDGELK
jgi:hypothetical protein